jgi:hypothetical protein
MKFNFELVSVFQLIRSLDPPGWVQRTLVSLVGRCATFVGKIHFNHLNSALDFLYI